MKKILAVLLALAMSLSMLVSCGSEDKKDTGGDKAKVESSSNESKKDDDKDDESSKAQGTQSQQGSVNNAGGISPILKTDRLEVDFNVTMADGTTMMGAVAIQDNTSPAKLFFRIDDESAIYELADDGTITKKVMPADGYEYVVDTTATQESLKQETDGVLGYLACAGWGWCERNPDLTYRVTDDYFSLFGGSDSTCYEALRDGTVVAVIWVDNQTGVFNYLQTSDYTFTSVLASVGDEVDRFE